MTPDEAFLADIIDHPDDDNVRLIYADWLEDHGQADRAAFIRVACTLAKLDDDDSRREELGARHRDLLKKHEREWVGPLADLAKSYWFVRGFVEGIQIQAATLLRQAEAVFHSTPVRVIHLHNAEGMTGALAVCPYLGRVTVLNLYGSNIRDAGLRELLSSPFLQRLRSLDLGHTRISLAGLHDLLAHSHHLPTLTELGLGWNDLGDEAVGALAASPLSARLRDLDLSRCLSGAGVRALASSTSFGELRDLNLNGCQAGDAECEALASSRSLRQFTGLGLSGRRFDDPSRITAAGLAALVNSPNCSHLKSLHLDNCQIGDAELEVLASAELRELRYLWLSQNLIGGPGVQALTRSRFWRHLQVLDLGSTPIGDAGANELLAAHPPQFITMFLADCQISKPLQEALQERYGDRVGC
jgi:uncharacterized protein (TIGR02996 family)